MKNIHLIKTDKPSRLHLWTDENGTRPALCELEYSHTRNTQNIYITSNEEIKEGDWYENNGVIFKADDVFDKGNNPNNSNPKVTDFNIKIILTTDQDLIKDGVQAIDDEFLKWFVKNPSCEEIEIELDYDSGLRIIDGKNLGYYSYIIPKEEPKQIKCYCGHTTMCDCSPIDEPKQEEIDFYAKELMLEKERAYKQGTLEKAGAIAAGLCEHLEAKEQAMFIAGFQECLKWQQERRYSEEDLRKAWEDGRNNVKTVGTPPFVITKFQHNSFSKWFEKFKKK